MPPLTGRHAHWVTRPFAMGEMHEDAEPKIEWAKAFRRDITGFTDGGTHLNFIGQEGQARIRAAYGHDTYERLQRVKAEWDPTNIFQGNQNKRPA